MLIGVLCFFFFLFYFQSSHCIVGGIIGVGFATIGAGGVQWGWRGVAQVFAAWGIAPAISGAFAAIIFLLTKYTVLQRKDPLKAGLRVIPVYFFFTSGILTMVIVWKGAPSLNLDDWNTGQVVGCIFGVGSGVALLSWIFFVPFLHRKLVDEDWTLKWWEFVYGPLLYRRGPVPPVPEGFQVQLVQDYYRGHATRADLEAANMDPEAIIAAERARALGHHEKSISSSNDDVKGEQTERSGDNNASSLAEDVETKPWYPPSGFLHFLRYKSGPLLINAFLHGVRKDVISSQNHGKWGNVVEMHTRAAHFDNKTEHLYSFLQILTAATASFAHGANDLSNAVGPLASIFLIYDTGTTGRKAPVPVWVLVYGATAIVIGLWTYGYNIMRNLGNRLTLMSPSRGFSMELVAATTVVLATRLALPVSTTQCIVGAVIGVGLCNGDMKAVNWRMVAWCYGGWIFTLPIAATIAGCIMAYVSSFLTICVHVLTILSTALLSTLLNLATHCRRLGTRCPIVISRYL